MTATAIKKGDTARLIQPEIKGTVLKRRINPAADELELLVEFADAEGGVHRRWFDVDRLELVAPAAAEGADGAAVEITADDVGDAASLVGGTQP